MALFAVPACGEFPGGQSSSLLSERYDQSAWKRCGRTVWRVVLDDVVLATLESDCPPIALAGGAWLWTQLEEARTVSELVSAMVDGSEEELLKLLGELERIGLVERVKR